ncbi:MAG: response regulator transcription factor [Candidatus Melainabacteria bacterium]|nr:response regulator transcription factor [Candidatus Melainabacteria bacterium]
MMRSTETTKIGLRVLIVDDNPNHSAGIKQLLELQSSYKIAGICTNGEEALKRINNADIDVVLMDMNMPEVDGINAIQQILARRPEIKILALTGYDDPELVFRAMRNGARGYILKTMVTSQLISAIEDIAASRVFLPTTLATKFFDEFHNRVSDSGKPDPNKQAMLSYLTSREKEVLKLLTEGITYKGVADRLVISETTVKTHVNNIFQKLQVNDRTQAVLYALKYGLVDTSNKLPTAV